MRTVEALPIVFALTSLAATGAAAPTVTINAPSASTVVDGKVPIAATLASPYVISSGAAASGSANASLSCGNTSCSGFLDVTAEPTGTITIVVSATDVLASTGSASVNVVHDHAPKVSVQTVDGYVARPFARLQATCADTDTFPCASVTASVKGGGSLATAAGGTLDQTVSLATYEGKKLQIEFVAKDTANVSSTVATIDIYVDTSPRFQEIARCDGPILDVDATRLLFDGQTSLVVRPRGGGPDVALAGKGGPAYLTLLGATWTTGELRSSVMTPRPTAPSLIANSKYVAYAGAFNGNGPSELWYRDVVADTTTKIPVPHPNPWAVYAEDVAENGDALYTVLDSSSNNLPVVYRFRNGTLTQLTSSAYSRFVPRTDGQRAVFSWYVTGMRRLQTFLYENGVESVLADDVPGGCGYKLNGGLPSARPPDDFALNSGWIAFTKADLGCARMLYTRDPNGVIALASVFATDTYIKAVAEDGNVIYATGGATYEGKAGGGPPTKLADNDIGRFVRLGGSWYRILGASLFSVGPNNAGDGGLEAGPGGDASDGAADDGGALLDAETADGSDGGSQQAVNDGGCIVSGSSSGGGLAGFVAWYAILVRYRRQRRR